DAVYNPAQTELLARAAGQGLKTAGGMPMLVWQAAQAHRHWYGGEFRPEDIADLIREAAELV
ncbi:MAG: shikimate dehydrogenase, partial [Oscillospiraceae bacterium]|nr:shikimate dehydrogenase [Oscillospiraceae bacterium]